jgi:putative ABC transport system substrate-binding protein
LSGATNGAGFAAGSDPFFFARREQIAALAVRHAVPALHISREFAMAGGLMSYGASISDASRQAGILYRPDSQGRQAG